jgi:hypothetical protein
VFDHGLPTNVTGLAYNHTFEAGVDFVAYVCNGWDRNAEDNKSPTLGGRLGYETANGVGLGLSAIRGREDAGPGAFTRTVIDVDLAYASGDWTFGGEFNRGSVEPRNGSDAEWTGFLAMAHVDTNEWLGFTGRFDMFNDADGFAFGMEQTRSSFTFAPTFALDEGFGALVEIRLDKSDEDVWVDRDGDPTDQSLGLAAEATYSW